MGRYAEAYKVNIRNIVKYSGLKLNLLIVELSLGKVLGRIEKGCPYITPGITCCPGVTFARVHFFGPPGPGAAEPP